MCGLAFFNEDGVNIIGPNSIRQPLKSDCKEIIFTIPNLPLTAGSYKVTIVIFDKDTVKQFEFLDRWYSFSVVSNHQAHGVVEIMGKWDSK